MIEEKNKVFRDLLHRLFHILGNQKKSRKGKILVKVYLQ